MDVMFAEMVAGDVAFSVFSCFFVIIYMGFHLGSSFLAAASMVNILFSFSVTHIIYRGALGIEFYSTLHQLTIFIVLGIAADDVFVFADAWR